MLMQTSIIIRTAATYFCVSERYSEFLKLISSHTIPYFANSLEEINFENDDGEFDRQVDDMEKNDDIANEYCP